MPCADFSIPVDSVSLDVTTDDASDVGVLRAYAPGGRLLHVAYSGIARPGQSRTMTIESPSGNIGYIVASGVGNDSVLLDHLVFGLENGTDVFSFEIAAQQPISIAATAPAEGPYQFHESELFREGGGSSLQMELIDPAGVSQAIGSTSLSYFATTTGRYEVHVSSADSPGEYFLQWDGLNLAPVPPVVIEPIESQVPRLGQFPSVYALTFSEAINLASIQPSDLVVGGLPALAISATDSHRVTFQLDPAANVGNGSYEVALAAGAVTDLQGHGNQPFTGSFLLEALQPFEPLGPLGGLAYLSRNHYIDVTESTTAARFSFFAQAGEKLALVATPTDPLTTLTIELEGVTGPISSPAPGLAAVLADWTANAGDYVTIVVGGDGSDDFSMDVFRNIDISDWADDPEVVTATSVLGQAASERFTLAGRLPVVGDEDAYEFDLTPYEGQAWDFVLQGTDSVFGGLMELFDSSGAVVATASASTGTQYDQSIFGYRSTVGGVHTLRVGGDWTGDYVLLGSPNMVFDDAVEGSGVRDLSAASGAVGYVGPNDDVYQIRLAAGASLSLNTSTPLDSSLAVPTNVLDPGLLVRAANGDVLSGTSRGPDRKNADLTFTAPEAGVYEIVVVAEEGMGEYVLVAETSGNVDVDFNDDELVDCEDIDALIGAIASGANDPAFDLNDDGLVNTTDRDLWLADGARANGYFLPYILGDANLDGNVDVSDFNLWNAHRFTFTPRWCRGDFNADGGIDASDFNIWNSHKFTSSASAAATISDATAVEGEFVVFDVQLSTPLLFSSSLNLLAKDLSATGGLSATGMTDFDNHGFEYSTDGGDSWQPTGGNSGSEITFPAGVAALKVRIQSFDDNMAEPAEKFLLDAFSVSGSIHDIVLAAKR